MQRKSSDGGWFWWLIAALVVLAIVIYAVSGIGHLLGLTPTGDEVLDEDGAWLSKHYEGIVAGYVLTVLVIVAPVAAYFLVRWWQRERPEDMNSLYGVLGTPALVLVLLVALLPIGARDRSHFAGGPRSLIAGDDSRGQRGPSGEPSAKDGDDQESRRDQRRERDRGNETDDTADVPDQRPGIPSGAKRTTITDVADGDTVDLAGLGSTRLIGVDTPEVYFGAECFGAQASEFTKAQLPVGTTVYYQHGVQTTDDYGRDLVYLWLSGGTFFNALLAKEGYAAQLTIPPNVEYADLFRRLVSSAREAGRGLWSTSTCAGDTDAPAQASGGQASSGSGGGAVSGESDGVSSGSGNCESGYDPCVPTYPPDVDCADVDGPIAVSGSDPHGLDADSDGVGCE